MTIFLNSLQVKRFARLIFLCIIFCGVTASAEATTQKCDSWLKRSKDHIAQNWRAFRSELKEQGPIRLVLAPRPDGARFNKMAAFLDPLIDLPLETYSYFSAKFFAKPLQRRLSFFTSLPVGLVAWSLLFGTIDMKADQWAIESLDRSIVEDVNGAEYASEFVLSGTLTPGEAMRMVAREQEEAVHDLENLRRRATQFQNLNLWTPDQVRTMNEVIDRLRAHHTPDEVQHRKTLLKILASDGQSLDFFKALPPERQFTKQLLLEPMVMLHGRPDAYWLGVFFEPYRRSGLSGENLQGLNSIESIYKMHSKDLSLTTLTQMVAETLSEPRAAQGKAAKAKALGFDHDYAFIHRADVPLFSQAEVFTDLDQEVKINDELDRWNLMLKDQRFAAIQKAWTGGQISELTALLRTDFHLRALSQVYAMARIDGEKLKSENACVLISGAGEDLPPNPLFVKFGEVSSPALKLKLAEITFRSFVEAAKAPAGSDLEPIFKRAIEEEKQAVRDAAGGGQTQPAVSCLQ